MKPLKDVNNLRRRLYLGFNYRLRTFAGGRWADRCKPTDIAFLLSGLCNSRCVHCDIWKRKGKPDYPSFEQYKAVLSELRRWLGPVAVYFTGGEALLTPYTTDLVAFGSSLGLFVEVLTHGYWDDQSRIRSLALARPSRVTVSLDGIGETHSKIRGREKFWEKTTASIDTLVRTRRDSRLDFIIRLKTVVMSHNLGDVAEVARFAARNGLEIFYQPIEQTYDTPEDPRWFEHSENWPRETDKAVAAVSGLIELKRQGLPIVNSDAQLNAMIPYFRDPAASRVAVQSHIAHEQKPVCSALTLMQVLPNGDVLACYGMPPVGNIRNSSIREIWESRPRWWRSGCCLDRRCTDTEKQKLEIANDGPK